MLLLLLLALALKYRLCCQEFEIPSLEFVHIGDTVTTREELVGDSLRAAFHLGQVYILNDRVSSDDTAITFNSLVADTLTAMSGLNDEGDETQ